LFDDIGSKANTFPPKFITNDSNDSKIVAILITKVLVLFSSLKKNYLRGGNTLNCNSMSNLS
jgi:hypothetical protein